MMAARAKRASKSPSWVPHRVGSAFTAVAIEQLQQRKTVTYQKSSQLYVVSDNLAFRQSGIYQRQEVSQLQKDRSVRRSVLRWLNSTVNLAVSASSPLSPNANDYKGILLLLKLPSAIVLVWAQFWVSIFDQKKKKKTNRKRKQSVDPIGSCHFQTWENGLFELCDRQYVHLWFHLYFSLFYFLFFLNQSAGSSLRPSPPFSVPACWFNQDKQLGTGSVELVSKPRLIYWLPRPPLYLTG